MTIIRTPLASASRSQKRDASLPMGLKAHSETLPAIAWSDSPCADPMRIGVRA